MNHQDTAQQRASDPAYSVWVSANAGTGKTKVLTDRVLRLLLEGVPAQGVLCLTFTKAASAEMLMRIQKTLQNWSLMPDEALRQALQDLQGAPPSAEVMQRARQLFFASLEEESRPVIQTLHAFCQSLLRRFPLEAQLLPHFQVMDEQTSRELMQSAWQQLLVQMEHTEDTALKHAFIGLASQLHETTLQTLLHSMMQDRAEWEHYFLQHRYDIPAMQRQLADFLALPVDPLASHKADELCVFSKKEAKICQALATWLVGGNAKEQAHGQMLQEWLEGTEDKRHAMLDRYTDFFLTKEGAPRKVGGVLSAALRRAQPDASLYYAQLQDCVVAWAEDKKALQTYEKTVCLIHVVEAFLALYTAQKQRRGMLDYHDLILKTVQLLERPGSSAWVMYKLDSGIEHVLIDEAQDTSALQWRIVAALCAEFFVGSGQQETARTLFVVGDKKQSIFSFQGASPHLFSSMQRGLAEQVIHAQGRWREVQLDYSFRSTSQVLQLVDAVFLDPAQRQAFGVEDMLVQHRAHRYQAPGRVEVWPLIEKAEASKEPTWPIYTAYQGEKDAVQLLAQRVASTIASWLKQGRFLPAKNRSIQAGDIMILVRRRDRLVDSLLHALESHQVPVAGLDRLLLTEHVAVMDLMVLADLLLHPEDDLALATVLRSPLCGLEEEALFRLAHDRGAQSLWARLEAYQKKEQAFEESYRFLSALYAMVDFMTPFHFFTQVLDVWGKRRDFIRRMGQEVLDPLQVFMEKTLEYERTHVPSLQGFLHWLRSGGMEVKRDLEQGTDQVRILTVHGAKGLQAPVVLLPDTTQVPRKRASVLWEEEKGMPVYVPARAGLPKSCAALVEREESAQYHEYMRLLYVALTRAEDELYVAGALGTTALDARSWYAHIAAAIAQMPEAASTKLLPTMDAAEAAPGWVLCDEVAYRDVEEGAISSVPTEEAEDIALPDWAVETSVAPKETAVHYVAPSRGVETEASAPTLPHEEAVEYGKAVHRLLEMLPEIEDTDQEDVARLLLTQDYHFSAADMERAYQTVARVFEDEDCRQFFGPGSMAEVPLAGFITTKEGKKQPFAGQVDRLAFEGGVLHVIDYKSGRDIPDGVEGVPQVYLKQMAIYRSLLEAIYPDHQIKSWLLWTAGPVLMELPAESLQRAGP